MREINSNDLSGNQLALEALVTGMQADAEEFNSTLLQEAAQGVEEASNALVEAVCKLEAWEDEAERAEKDSPLNEPDDYDETESEQLRRDEKNGLYGGQEDPAN